MIAPIYLFDIKQDCQISLPWYALVLLSTKVFRYMATKISTSSKEEEKKKSIPNPEEAEQPCLCKTAQK